MKSISLAVALISTLFAATPAAHAQSAHSTGRGAVQVRGRAVKAVTMGPVLVHGYSGFAGGALFVAPVVAGTDADCAAALANHADVRATTLIADRMAYIQVGAGQMACLVTETPRSFELLWHAFTVEGTETYLAANKTR